MLKSYRLLLWLKYYISKCSHIVQDKELVLLPSNLQTLLTLISRKALKISNHHTWNVYNTRAMFWHACKPSSRMINRTCSHCRWRLFTTNKHQHNFLSSYFPWNWTGVYHHPLNFPLLDYSVLHGGHMGLDGWCIGAREDCPMCWKVTKRFVFVSTAHLCWGVSEQLGLTPGQRTDTGWAFLGKKNK